MNGKSLQRYIQNICVDAPYNVKSQEELRLEEHSGQNSGKLIWMVAEIPQSTPYSALYWWSSI